jgi:hypothetical protein
MHHAAYFAPTDIRTSEQNPLHAGKGHNMTKVTLGQADRQ